jgi:hypothetical protein
MKTTTRISLYRCLAEEMRVIASCASNDGIREGFLHAAENYERVATTLEAVEKSEIASAKLPA